MAPQGWADGSQTWPNRFHQSRNEEALYDFCTELLQNRSVSDATYARAVAKFGERALLDTIGLMGHYSLIGMVLNTARTPVAPGGPPVLERFPR